MSPGRSPRGRYEPWKPPELPPPKTKAEAARRATDWDSWWQSQPAMAHVPGFGMAARIGQPPPALDWQRNPKAPCPPGYVWGRCPRGSIPVRPGDWRGQVAQRDGSRRPIKPSYTIGTPCWCCGAPLRRVSHRSEPYVAPETYVLNRCLCGLVVTRFGPQSTAGPCPDCGAPWQVVKDSDQPYVIDLSELPEAPDARAYWRAQDLEGWAFGDTVTPME